MSRTKSILSFGLGWPEDATEYVLLAIMWLMVLLFIGLIVGAILALTLGSDGGNTAGCVIQELVHHAKGGDRWECIGWAK
jgi:hypothetical protein